MKKLVAIMLLSLILIGCQTPESIKIADKKSYELNANFAKGSVSIITKSIQAFRKEAYNNIDFRAGIALKQGKDAKEVAAWTKKKKEAVNTTVSKVLKKTLAIKGDWEKSMLLRAQVSGYLRIRPNIQDIIKTIGEN